MLVKAREIADMNNYLQRKIFNCYCWIQLAVIGLLLTVFGDFLTKHEDSDSDYEEKNKA